MYQALVRPMYQALVRPMYQSLVRPVNPGTTYVSSPGTIAMAMKFYNILQDTAWSVHAFRMHFRCRDESVNDDASIKK